MKYIFIDHEKNTQYRFYTKEASDLALKHTKSKNAEVIRIPEGVNDFTDLCIEKYGDDVKFKIIYKLIDSDEIESITAPSVFELIKDLTKLILHKKIKYADLIPVVNGKCLDDECLIYPYVKPKWNMYNSEFPTVLSSQSIKFTTTEETDDGYLLSEFMSLNYSSDVQN